MSKVNYSLAIIDMQPYFSAANNPKTVENCIKQIKLAKKVAAHILLLEFAGYGDSHPDLLKHLVGYKRLHILQKTRDDGSNWIMRRAREQSVPIENIRVAGVNTSYCVYSTVAGLVDRADVRTIRVIADACNAAWQDDHERGIRDLKRLPKVAVT